MDPINDEENPDSGYQLDPNEPLVLLLGWVDHEGILSSLKATGRQYKKKLVDSSPQNWSTIADLFDQFTVSAVVGKLPAHVLHLIVLEQYRGVRDRLFSAIGSVRNQIFLYEDIFTGKQSDSSNAEYFSYPDPAVIDEALAFLKSHNVEVIPYARKAEVTVLADAFLDETDRNLIFRLYVPIGRIWSGEADRFLQLFQDYLVRVERLQVRLDQKRTEHGVVYEFHGHPPEGQRSLVSEFGDFSELMRLFQSDVEAAAAEVASKGASAQEIERIVTRYAKEARRLQLDLRHEAEAKSVAIRHRLESELMDLDPSPKEWIEISKLVTQSIPSMSEAIIGDPLYLGRPTQPLGPSTTNITYNLRPQFISSVSSVIAEEINGNQHFEPEHHRLLELASQHGGSRAKELETAVYEVADKGVEKVDRLKAKQKLTAFLIELGKKTGDLAFGVLQSYIEKQLGL
ncbi:hypothetical protein PAQ31011_04846 [Pandoraea aquatica]|uniref:Uncharacterized protein n=1 Tax=Pandoraea aquatica TaxID=2508290 RepID=A0A5E4YW60_9BURK|nr:hypothetical protein [Pandoraea aquatica]VVE53131.1 hypothetical protein PAQ31011_04846 [Pandoraea aquatica]